MPRKKKTIVEETIPDEPIGIDSDTDIVCVLTKVYKLSGGGKSFCFQTTEPVDEVTIQAQYPTGGKFVVFEFNSLNQQIGTTHIDIEPKPLALSAANGNGDIRSQMLLEELAFTRNMMLQMIQGLFQNKTQQAATPLGELAQAMQVVHQLSPVGNPVDLIVKGMELGINANGGAPDWKAQLVSSAKELVPAIMTARQQTQPIQNVQQPITLPPAALIKQGIDWIKPKIIGGMDTGLAIEWVIRNGNDPLFQQLLANAIQGDINTFIQLDAEIANEPYRTWFTTAIQQIKEWYAAQQSADQNDNERGDRDDTDLTDDEVISVGKPKVVKVG